MTDEEMMNCSEKGRQMERLRAIMHRLRAPGGCPWDAEQTHQSIVSNLIEETYEAVAAIEAGDTENLREELGDVLLQVVFHSELAEEAGTFDFDEVAREVSEKLIRRHPHVYAQGEEMSANEVLAQWHEIKRAEKGIEEKPYLDGVGKGLPAILKATNLQKKASKVGFDWEDAAGMVEKIQEEFDEMKEELAKVPEGEEATEELRHEIGDLLFIVVNLARKMKVDAEAALEGTNRKFTNRFQYVEESLAKVGKNLAPENKEAMEEFWLEAKGRDSRLSNP